MKTKCKKCLPPSTTGVVEYFEDKSKKRKERFRFRVIGGNYETQATSEGYRTKGGAKKGFRDLQATVTNARVVENW